MSNRESSQETRQTVRIEATCADCGYTFECDSADVCNALIDEHQASAHDVRLDITIEDEP